MKKRKFVNFDDTKIPIGKRKMLFVKWLMSVKKYKLNEAKLLCYKKFYYEEKNLWIRKNEFIGE